MLPFRPRVILFSHLCRQSVHEYMATELYTPFMELCPENVKFTRYIRAARPRCSRLEVTTTGKNFV